MSEKKKIKKTPIPKKKTKKVPKKAPKKPKKKPKVKPLPDSQEDHDLAVEFISDLTGASHGRSLEGSAERYICEIPNDLKKGRGGQPGNNNAAKWTEELAVRLAEDMLSWLKKQNTNVFYNEFLVEIKNLHPQVISELSKRYDSFKKLIEKAKSIKCTKLWKYGTAGVLNSGMTKFCLTNHHGASDKIEQTHMGPDGTAMPNSMTISFVDVPKEQKEREDHKDEKVDTNAGDNPRKDEVG